MSDTAAPPSNQLFIAASLALMIALLAGGTARPFNDLAILLGSLPLIYLVISQKSSQPMAWTAKLAIALLVLALLQLVPLPPTVWTALPGRELAASALAASGNPLGWRPLALDPGAAGIALISCAAPIALHLAVTRMHPRHVRKLLAYVAGFALLSALLGIIQRLSGGLALYATEHQGAALGLFTNRNHHAELLIAGMFLLVALIPLGQRRKFRLFASALIALLFFAVIATTSRAGIALSIPAAIAALIAIWEPNRRTGLLLVMGAIAAGCAILLIPAFSDIFSRFGMAADDQRITMARDSLVAARAMWPAGSGYGSFVPVFMAYEDLDMMEARYVVAAHNDYLQLALEGGITGIVTGIAAILAMIVLAWNIAQDRSHALAWGALGVAVTLLAHSAVDFPLRTGALAMLFGLCTGAAQCHFAALRRA